MTLLLRLAADAVVLFHLAFVLFVVFGGLLVCRWPRLVWLHLPAVGWGALIEFTGWICPLTPLENHLRQAVGASRLRRGLHRSLSLAAALPGGTDPRGAVGAGGRRPDPQRRGVRPPAGPPSSSAAWQPPAYKCMPTMTPARATVEGRGQCRTEDEPGGSNAPSTTSMMDASR